MARATNSPKSAEDTELLNDMELAVENLNSAIARIEHAGAPLFSPQEIREITGMLQAVFSAARPHFISGRNRNPISHHTQVLDNMVRIGLGQRLEYRQFKNAALLALLHDIGNALCSRPKFKTDQVIEAFKHSATEGLSTARKAIEFRLEHMNRGAELAGELLADMILQGKLSGADVDLICRAVSVHDNPSVAMVLQKLADETDDEVGYEMCEFLLPFDSSPFGQLVELIREADRLYMLSEQGIGKDLRDANEEPTAGNVLARLESNENRHAEEFELYERAGKAEGFRSGTLYRTAAGYEMSIEASKSVRAKWKTQD
ncbi:MAG: hypothetical protein QGH94_00095 [Phycisphaerae bacterium]|jgi:hypothetical protein|nr:hypothetical protein [Phycisphaerae bacterium]